MNDFSLTPPPEFELQAPPAKRKATQRRGYADFPGTGPAGETCASCAHSVKRLGKYYKCGLMKAIWTGGQGSDILFRAPACSKWQNP